jgi:hypothetical protein
MAGLFEAANKVGNKAVPARAAALRVRNSLRVVITVGWLGVLLLKGAQGVLVAGGVYGEVSLR